MRATSNRYWIRAVLVSLAAFALGGAMYVVVGIAVAHGESRASAAWQQVAIQPLDCECILKFVPEQPLVGDGDVGSPYVSYNSQLSLVVGVASAGLITIEDQDGRVLFTYNKVSSVYEEVVAVVKLLDKLGVYELTVKLDGVKRLGPGVLSPMFVDYRGLPLPPGPPNTGGAGHLYIGGYAVQTFGVLLAGLWFGAVAFFIFAIVAVRRQKQEAENARDNAALGRTIKREFSLGAIDKSGIVGKKKIGNKKRRK
jgi:hypothetical protein